MGNSRFATVWTQFQCIPIPKLSWDDIINRVDTRYKHLPAKPRDRMCSSVLDLE